jgi:hypothetical protein
MKSTYYDFLMKNTVENTLPELAFLVDDGPLKTRTRGYCISFSNFFFILKYKELPDFNTRLISELRLMCTDFHLDEYSNQK